MSKSTFFLGLFRRYFGCNLKIYFLGKIRIKIIIVSNSVTSHIGLDFFLLLFLPLLFCFVFLNIKKGNPCSDWGRSVQIWKVEFFSYLEFFNLGKCTFGDILTAKIQSHAVWSESSLDFWISLVFDVSLCVKYKGWSNSADAYAILSLC